MITASAAMTPFNDLIISDILVTRGIFDHYHSLFVTIGNFYLFVTFDYFGHYWALFSLICHY
jgi:hypothetical protein